MDLEQGAQGDGALNFPQGLIVCISKKWLPGPQENSFGWQVYISKVRERIYDCKVSKVTVLKEIQGPICLTF